LTTTCTWRLLWHVSFILWPSLSLCFSGGLRIRSVWFLLAIWLFCFLFLFLWSFLVWWCWLLNVTDQLIQVHLLNLLVYFILIGILSI
jgi:hypothetical protein